jgi:hypothetical protein
MLARVETIAGNKELYSTRDIAGAERARNELRQLDFPSIQTYLKMSQRNSIVGSRVTPDDVRRMVRIYGPDIASLKGKTKRVTQAEVSADRSLHFVVPTGITIHLDVMFVQGLPFLIGVAMPLSYILCALLKGRSYSVVKDMLFGFVGRLKAYGFVVKTIFCDGDGAVVQMKGDLAREGIDLNPTSREHVPVVENRIKTVKEKVRGLIAILRFVLSLTFLVYAMVNKAPSETMSEFIAPITALTGRPVHVEDIRWPYLEVHERGTWAQNSVTNARTRSCLVLYPRDNLQHSRYFYCLDKGTLIARDRNTL